MIVEHLEQGTPEWFAARIGRPTASGFSKILTAGGKRSSTRKGYMAQLASERMTGKQTEFFKGKALERGKELEPEARDFFAFTRGVEIQEVGLCYPDERKLYSCSPDGLLADRGIEIKCPHQNTHVLWLADGKLPSEHVVQVQGSMLVTGFDKWEFFAYHPDLPNHHITVARDDDYCAKLKAELEVFCEELAEMVERAQANRS